MASVFNRLRTMRGEELTFRTRAAARVHAQRVSALVRRPRWERAALLGALSPAFIDDALVDAVANDDWSSVQRRLEDLIGGRPARYVIDPAERPRLRAALLDRWPAAANDAARAGSRIAGGEYDLLGYRGLRFTRGSARVDWHFDPVHDRTMPRAFWADVRYLDPRFGDHKIIWELNRHQHWLPLGRALWLTGDPVFADTLVAELRSWLDANPPLTGSNWSSMLELGLRSLSWVSALHLLLACGDGRDRGPWLADMLVGLDRQLTHVEQNLSHYFSPNTHLTGEALALYVTGVALPELRRSAQWTDAGRRVLMAEAGRQIAADGGHLERSTHYHRYTLDFYTLALLTAERAGDIEAAAVFTDAVSRLATFMRAIADDEGWTPLIGDDDGGMLWPIAGRDPRDVRDSLALAAVILGRRELAPWGPCEEAFWTGWSARPAVLERAWPLPAAARPPVRADGVRTQLMDETGYAIVRNRAGDHLVFDIGAHGYLNGGHAHADALSITLAMAGRPLLADPGTATYTMDQALRDRMRDTASHNTLTVDGRSSSIARGSFHWLSSADAQLERQRHNPRMSWVQASHDGFAPARHRRHVLHTEWGGWLIADILSAAGRHSAEAHWQFDPAWDVQADGAGRLRALDSDGRLVWMLHEGEATLERGNEQAGSGWCSPRYGALVPAWSATIARSGAGPLSLATWFGATDGHSRPVLERLPGGRGSGLLLAVRVRHGGRSIVTMIRDEADGQVDAATVLDCRTDASVVQWDDAGGRLRALAVADATHLQSEAFGSLIVETPVADLHVERCSADRLELWATQPPPRLVLSGTLVRGAHDVLLNGRAASRRPDAPEALTVSSADWADALSETIEVCAG